MASNDLENTDTEKQEELKDITTCCICTDIYTDPKALPCIHTFCMKCIAETGLKASKKPGDEMPCPICRRLFKIPPEGFPGLPKHFFIERLIQVSKFSVPSSEAMSLCSLCQQEIEEDRSTDKETPVAEAHCFDCKHSFCAKCCDEHRNFKLTKNHKLIPMAEYEREKNVSDDLAPTACEFHEQKVLDVFCADCRKVECATCFIEKHNNHKGFDVNSCVDEFRKQIENNIEAVNECIAQTRMKQAELAKVKEEMQRRVGNLQCDIERRKDEITRLTFEHNSSLLQDLCSERHRRLKELQSGTDDIETCLSNLESYNSHCQRLIETRSSSKICREITDLSVKATELQQQCQSVIAIGFQDFKFCFRQSELEEFLKEDCGNLIGKIEEDELELKERSKQMLMAEQSDEIDMLRKKAEELREQNANYEAQIEELKQELENNNALTIKLQVSNDKLKLEHHMQISTINSLQTSSDNEKANYESHMAKQKQELDDNKTAMNALQVHCDNLRQELDTEKLNNNSLQASSQSKKENYESQIEDLKQEVEDNKTKIDILEFSNGNLRQALDTEKSNNDSLLASSEKEKLNYGLRIEALKQELDDNKTTRDELMVSNDNLNKKLEAEQAKNNSLQAMNDELLEELKKCNATGQPLETHMETATVETGYKIMTNEELKRQFRSVYRRFVSDVDPDLLGDYLKQDNVLSIDRWYTTTAQKCGAKDKCRAVLDFLLTCDHPSAFLVVRKALEDVDHHILETIKKEEADSRHRTASKDIVCDQRFEQQLSKYKEQHRIDKGTIDELKQKLKAIEENTVTQTANTSEILH